MTRTLALAVLLALGNAGAAAPPDAFLDRPLPARCLPPFDHPPADLHLKPSRVPQYHSYALLAKAIQAASPRRVIFPPGWLEFVTAHETDTDWDKGRYFFLHGHLILSISDGCTIRQYLNNLFGQADLTWKYVPAQNALVSDFAWRRDDPRSEQKLLAVLLATRPRSINRFEPKPDPWSQAFDALLNKPQNFPRAWQIRFCGDDRAFLFGVNPQNNMVTGLIRDSADGEHILVVNGQREICNPGPPGSVSYYLFARDGRLESGGLCTLGYRCFDDSARLDDQHRRLDVRTYNNNGREQRDSIYELSGGVLRRTDYLINGCPPSLWQWSGLESGQTIFTTMGG